MRTTARGCSVFITFRRCVNQLKTSGRSRPLAILPSTSPVRAIARLPAVARRSDSPGTMTSESPAIQSRSGREGLNFWRGGGGGGSLAAGGSAGSATAVSIRSSCERPSTAFKPRLGRSRSSAWLTSSRGSATESATSRFQPSGWMCADLRIPGAFRNRPRRSAASDTTTADPAELSRRPPSPSRSGGRRRVWVGVVWHLRTGSR